MSPRGFEARRRFALSAAAAALLLLLALASLAGGAGPAPAPEPTHRLGFRPMVQFAPPVDMTGPPTYVQQLPGHPDTMIVSTKDGRLYAVRGKHVVMPPFLDLSDRVTTENVEQGFFSFAFSPKYGRTGRLYVAYTNLEGDVEVDEFRRGPDGRPMPGSRRAVIRIKHRQTPSHNGGQLAFHGRYLYIGVGDGGTPGDAAGNSQNLNSLLGKLLRIDPRRKGKAPYRIPPGNPFVGRPGRDEVYAYGFRNPFRFSFGPRAGDSAWLAIGDVGQDRFEEIDMTTVRGAWGANFGWPYFEGDRPFRIDLWPPPPTRMPILAYPHARGGEGNESCSVTGGVFVSAKGPGPLRGQYVYGDVCEDRLRTIVPTESGTADNETGLYIPSPFSFTEAANGKLYYTSYDGWLYEIGYYRSKPGQAEGEDQGAGESGKPGNGK